MHAISSYRGDRPTHKHTHKHTNTHTQTHRQDRLKYTARSVITQKVAVTITGRHTQKTRGQTETGLVGFYDIWPGNGAGLIFQPRSHA